MWERMTPSRARPQRTATRPRAPGQPQRTTRARRSVARAAHRPTACPRPGARSPQCPPPPVRRQHLLPPRHAGATTPPRNVTGRCVGRSAPTTTTGAPSGSENRSRSNTDVPPMVIAALSSLPSREPRPPASTRAVHPGGGETQAMTCSLPCHRASLSRTLETSAAPHLSGLTERRSRQRFSCEPADAITGSRRFVSFPWRGLHRGVTRVRKAPSRP
jgi:hypothetical protein